MFILIMVGATAGIIHRLIGDTDSLVFCFTFILFYMVVVVFIISIVWVLFL